MSENSAPDLRFGQAPTPQDEAPTPASPFSEQSAADEDLARRYGVKRGMSKGRKIILGVFGFAVLCAVVGYIAYNEANPKIQATVLSYTVNGQAINVTFEVDKKGGDRVECTLQAEDIKGDVIGSANVNVPADGRGKVVLVAQVNTTGTPNTAVVSSCTSAS